MPAIFGELRVGQIPVGPARTRWGRCPTPPAAVPATPTAPLDGSAPPSWSLAGRPGKWWSKTVESGQSGQKRSKVVKP